MIVASKVALTYTSTVPSPFSYIFIVVSESSVTVVVVLESTVYPLDSKAASLLAEESYSPILTAI